MRPQHTEADVVRVVPAGDIHDIRVLTATGPIQLPEPTTTTRAERRPA